MSRPAAVGFDLDMTLVDSRPGIHAAFRELTARTGVHVDADAAVNRLGPPLRTELAYWFPPEQIEDMVVAYRSLYPDFAITPSRPLPGAVEAIAHVRSLGLRVVVVSSKIERLVRLHLDHLGMAVDEVAGDLFAAGKSAALTAFGVGVYVGDHVADMVAAQGAGVPGIGVTTGPCSAAELTDAGASAVVQNLTELPGVLGGIAVGEAPRR
ncbi:HAD family hydrolase [Spirilliplanes yamanashiensis]|uniref:Hydrolase n=1 Tax=Spirilliplanes yamanashiensis TaxID=42233 RepID=A0A8J4DJ42_9ACTN|nr:HAD family hydrolase [Spirilliplanes yamanashiensis]MDP9815523.1 phosphoglycolate phosphatase [Spirilliplanes yamanashiensis]GIJ03777.1 hydrolase [Spirilliplanes yamanashiensis]